MTFRYKDVEYTEAPETPGRGVCIGCAFEGKGNYDVCRAANAATGVGGVARDGEWRCSTEHVIFVRAAPAPAPAPAPAKQMRLPSDPAVRKGMPITTGVLDYFPLALAEVARVSKAGNDQHNPGQPLHWAKGKSTDHADCIPRHLIDRGTFDTTDNPPQRHSAKLAWRALALLQTELEEEERDGRSGAL